MTCSSASCWRRGAGLNSVSRNRRIDLTRPRVDAAFQIEDLREPARFEEHRDVRAACAVVAHADDLRFVVELFAPGGNAAHRNRHAARDLRCFDFPWLPP